MNLKKIIAALALAVSAAPSFAYTECTSPVASVFFSGGSLYIFTVAGASALMASTHPDIEGAKSAAMASRLGGQAIAIRFTADGVSCTTSAYRTDVAGIWF